MVIFCLRWRNAQNCKTNQYKKLRFSCTFGGCVPRHAEDLKWQDAVAYNLESTIDVCHDEEYLFAAKRVDSEEL